MNPVPRSVVCLKQPNSKCHMRIKTVVTACSILIGNEALAQQPGCTQPASCTVPCQPPAGAPPQQPAGAPPQQDQPSGAFAAPPRTGTVFGGSRGIGFEGPRIDLHPLQIRLPTLTCGSLVRTLTNPRMQLDAASAPYTTDVRREFGVEAGNPSAGAPPAGAPGPNAGAPGCTQGAGAPNCVDPAAAAHLPPMPPIPQYEQGAFMQGGYIQDPATGRIYRVVAQPIAVQQQYAAAPVQYATQAQQYAAPVQQYAAPAQQYAAPVQYAAPTQQYQVMPASITREVPAAEQVQLQDALNASQRRQEELEAELRQVQALVGRMAQQQSAPAPAPVAVATPASTPVVSNVPLHEVGGTSAVSTDAASAEKPGLNRALRKLFAHAK